MKKVAVAVILIALSGAIAHWHFSDRGRFTTEPVFDGLARTVSGNTLTSGFDPIASVSFDPAFEYIGGQSFVLYGVADTEQHFFVETEEQGRLKSVYWIQFEAYLPDNSYTYDYDDSPLRVVLNGVEFFTDTAVFHNDRQRKRRRGTDGALARQFLARAGLIYPEEVVYARLVYLTDETRRKELMIIFMDDLAAYGLTAADLESGGARESQRPEVELAHLQRIESTLSVDLYPLSSDKRRRARRHESERVKVQHK